MSQDYPQDLASLPPVSAENMANNGYKQVKINKP